MPSFSDVYGNLRAKQLLKSALTSHQVSHAYIFEGAAGFGKHILAAAFVKALFCERFSYSGEQDACGVCPSCRLIESSNHPDVRWIRLEASSKKEEKAPSSISIDRIRKEIVEDMAILPYRSDKKVYIIEHAEKLTPQAQNALLKTIEEPPHYGHILLLAETSESLLPTIRSRCVTVHLDPLSDDLMIEALMSHGLKKEEAASYALNASGSLGLALLLSKDEAFGALRKELYRFLEKIPTLSKLDILRQETLFTAPSTNREWLFMLLSLWYRDILLLQTAHDPSLLLCQDHVSSLEPLASYYSAEKTLAILQRISKTKEDLQKNANLALAMDVLLASL